VEDSRTVGRAFGEIGTEEVLDSRAKKDVEMALTD
jgi:hypothetical protein